MVAPVVLGKLVTDTSSAPPAERIYGAAALRHWLCSRRGRLTVTGELALGEFVRSLDVVAVAAAHPLNCH